MKIVGIRYEVRPPNLCCLRLGVMKNNGQLSGDYFTIKHHDIPDVIDFFVLKQTYDTALDRNWDVGECCILTVLFRSVEHVFTFNHKVTPPVGVIVF